jgi:Protein of unknown function (DUF2934)
MLRSATDGVLDPGQRVGSPPRFRQTEVRSNWPVLREMSPSPKYLRVRPPASKRDVPFGSQGAQAMSERKATPRMSHIAPTSMRCNLGRGVTVERRIATTLRNQHERERIIALKAHEVFCSRGCEHGFDLDDWLRAEQELSSEADDVLLTQSTAGFEISLAERVEEACIILSIAPSSLLILWTRSEPDGGERGPVMQHSGLNLVSLPEAVDPEKADVTFHDGRVWLHLPYVGQGHSSSEPATVAQN